MLPLFLTASMIFFIIAIIILIYIYVQWIRIYPMIWIPGLLYGIIFLLLSITCSYAQIFLTLLTEKDKEDKN